MEFVPLDFLLLEMSLELYKMSLFYEFVLMAVYLNPDYYDNHIGN